MRIYVPIDWAGLAALVQAREVTAPVTAYTVTPELRAAVDSADEEELEEIARALAAQAGQLAGFGRPCVLAVDVEAGEIAVGPDSDGSVGEVLLLGAVPIGRLAAVLASEPGDGSDGAVDSDGVSGDDVELLWFAPQEIEFLLDRG